ncbi:hypothetical protein EC991_003087 [Linnemannia zychae]|nr:hypothetical protein EC991_003087 [Linnemannia zychae]
MASQEVAYLIFGYVGILLFFFLIGHCMYRSINYTLQIFCAAAILNNINESFLLLRYGDNVMTLAPGTPGCIFSAVFEQFIPLAVSSLATCMGFNIWYLIVMRSKQTEKEMLKWYCLYSFGIPFFVTSIALILLRNQPFLSSYPRKYYCDLGGTNITYWTFAVPMLVTAVLGILCAVHTVLYLLRHYFMLRRTLNSGTYSNGGGMSFELSYCIRLLIFCIGFGVLVLMAVLDTIVDPNARKATYNTSENLSNFSDFSGSLVGIVIFVIFGTTKDAFRTLRKIVFFVGTCGRDRNGGMGEFGGEGRGQGGRAGGAAARNGAATGGASADANANANAGGRWWSLKGISQSIALKFGRSNAGDSSTRRQWDWKGVFGRFGRRSGASGTRASGTNGGIILKHHQRVRTDSTKHMAYSVSSASVSAGSGFGGGSQRTLGTPIESGGKQELDEKSSLDMLESGPMTFSEIIMGAHNIINVNSIGNGNGDVANNNRAVLREGYEMESGYPPVVVLPAPPPFPPKPSAYVPSTLPLPASAPGTRVSSPPSFGNSGSGGQPMWQQYQVQQSQLQQNQFQQNQQHQFGVAPAANQGPTMVRPSSFSEPSPPPQSYFPRG